MSTVKNLLNSANQHFAKDDVNQGVDDLVEAAKQLKEQRLEVKGAFDAAIKQLSTTACKTSPPHTKALTLVKIRSTLPS